MSLSKHNEKRKETEAYQFWLDFLQEREGVVTNSKEAAVGKFWKEFQQEREGIFL